MPLLAKLACIVWLTASAQAQYVGTYAGTYGGDEEGTWSAVIDNKGKLTGQAVDDWGEIVPAHGTVGTSGQLHMVAGRYSEGVFQGQIDATGYVEGTWTNTRWGGSGTFEGSRTARPLPDIAVEQPSGTVVVTGATRNLGTFALKKKATFVFAVSNTGTADLSGLAVSVTGVNAADFKVTANLSAPLKPGKSKTFKVLFAPASAGVKSAQLRIASNDPDENPYIVNLTCTATAG